MSVDGANDRGAGARSSCGPLEPSQNPGITQRVTAILYSAEPGAEGRWTYVSPQIEAILGFTAEEWCGDPALWRRQLHPDDRDWVIAGEETGDHGEGATEYRMLHRDGHIVWLRDDALILTGDDGKPYWRGVLADITDRKHTEAELERAAAQHAAVARLGEHALQGASGPELAREAVSVAVDLLGVEFGGVLELDRERNHFDFLAAHGLPAAAVAAGLVFSQDTQAGYAITHGRMIIPAWATETRCAPTEPISGSAVRSGMSVLIEGRSEAFGVFGVHSRRPREYARIDIDFVQTLANVLGDAFARQRTEDHIRHRALHGGVGVADEVLGALATVTERDPHGYGDEVLVVVEGERPRELAGDPLGQVDGVMLAEDLLQQDPELVGAEASDRVRGAHGLRQAQRGRREQLVADLVAE
jgi:PAS domain S-box-containing protein